MRANRRLGLGMVRGEDFWLDYIVSYYCLSTKGIGCEDHRGGSRACVTVYEVGAWSCTSKPSLKSSSAVRHPKAKLNEGSLAARQLPANRRRVDTLGVARGRTGHEVSLVARGLTRCARGEATRAVPNHAIRGSRRRITVHKLREHVRTSAVHR